MYPAKYTCWRTCEATSTADRRSGGAGTMSIACSHVRSIRYPRRASARSSAGEGRYGTVELVLRLLNRSGYGDEQYMAPAVAMVRAVLDTDTDADDLPPDATIDRYRIIGRLGRGGMATVYRAERSDGSYEQQVALKVLRRGVDTTDLIRRFLVERQILSSLTHPNIARILDGGSTGDGRPPWSWSSSRASQSQHGPMHTGFLSPRGCAFLRYRCVLCPPAARGPPRPQASNTW